MGIGETKLGKLCVALSAAALLNGCAFGPSRVKPSEILQSEKISDIERPAPYSDALAFYLSDHCDAAWNLLWPLAKRGDNDARFILAESLAFGCDMPIRVDRYDDRTRLSLMLAAYAISEPARYPISDDETVFRGRLGVFLLSDGHGAETVRTCYVSLVDSKDLSLASAKKCLNKAISLGVMKPFKEFAADVDQLAAK
jgi:hypothetical protein